MRQGRRNEELHELIRWLSGYIEKQLQKHIKGDSTYKLFLLKAKPNPYAYLIIGATCDCRIKDIPTLPTQLARYLDKLVDEFAKVRKMENILRES